MPLRLAVHSATATDGTRYPSLEGLSDDVPTKWMPWDPAVQGPVIGVQHDIAVLAEMAEAFQDLLPSLAAGGVDRADEDLTEWYFSDDAVMVDLTLVMVALGRDLASLGVSGRVALEGV